MNDSEMTPAMLPPTAVRFFRYEPYDDQRCQWFALCDHRADGVVAHPILGAVPTCQRCADMLALDIAHD